MNKVEAFPRLLDPFQNVREDFDKIYTDPSIISAWQKVCKNRVGSINGCDIYVGGYNNQWHFCCFDPDFTKLLFTATTARTSSRDLFYPGVRVYTPLTMWKLATINLGHKFSTIMLDCMFQSLRADAIVSDLQQTIAFNKTWFRFLQDKLPTDTIYIGTSLRKHPIMVMQIENAQQLTICINRTIGMSNAYMKRCSFVVRKGVDVSSLVKATIVPFNIELLDKEFYELVDQLSSEELNDLIQEYKDYRL